MYLRELPEALRPVLLLVRVGGIGSDWRAVAVAKQLRGTQRRQPTTTFLCSRACRASRLTSRPLERVCSINSMTIFAQLAAICVFSNWKMVESLKELVKHPAGSEPTVLDS